MLENDSGNAKIMSANNSLPITLSKLVLLYESKFASTEHKGIRAHLSEIILAMNAAYKYYPIESKLA